MVATMAAIINVGEGMINPVGGQPGTCSYPGYLLWTLTEQEQFPPPHFRTIPPAYTYIDIKCHRRLYFLKKSAHPRLTILTRLK